MWPSLQTAATCAVLLAAFFICGASAVNASVPLGGYCNATSNCSTQYSECINSACQCPAGRVININGNICLPVAQSVNDSCSESNQCSSVANTACMAGRCYCTAGFVYSNGRCINPASGSTTPGYICSTNYDCRHIDNSECNYGRCVCRPGYQPSPDGQRCTAASVSTPAPIYCNSNNDCRHIRNAQCQSNRCVCRRGFRPTPDGQHCSTGAALRALLVVVMAGLMFGKVAA